MTTHAHDDHDRHDGTTGIDPDLAPTDPITGQEGARESGDAGAAPDTAYSPSSERETAARQDDPHGSETDVALEGDDVLPGTGGPDDTGDVERADDLSVAQALCQGHEAEPAAAAERGEADEHDGSAQDGDDPLDRGPVETDPLEPHGIGLTETLHHGSGPGDPGDGIAPGTDLGARP